MLSVRTLLGAVVVAVMPAALADDDARRPAGEAVSFDYAGDTCTLTFQADGSFRAEGRPALCSGWNASWVMLEGDVMITYEAMSHGRAVCGPWPDYRVGDSWTGNEGFDHADPTYNLDGDPLCWLRDVGEAHLIDRVTVITGSPH